MQRWKTLKRGDPEFTSYLTGRFSHEYRAIPMRSLNVNTALEEVTFEIIPMHEIQVPAWPFIFVRAIRPQTLLLSLNPLLVTLAFCLYLRLQVQTILAFSSLFGVLLFHISINLLNDFHDHLRGQDRVNPTGGSRLIQNGWVNARTIQTAGLITLGAAVLCGLPAVLTHFSLSLMIALITLIAGIEFSSDRLGLKYRGLGEVIVFLLSGPLLSAGFSWAITGVFRIETILLGFVFGFTTALFYHLANLEDIMVDSQANVRTLAAWLGFDESKKLLRLLGGLAVFSLAAFALAIHDGRVLAFGVVAQLGVLLPMYQRVQKIASPLSSNLRGVRSLALVLQGVTSLAVLIGLLCKILWN